MAMVLVIALCSALVGIKPVESEAISYSNSSLGVSEKHEVTAENMYAPATGNVQLVSNVNEISATAGVTNKLTTDITGGLTVNGDTYTIDLAGHKWTSAGNVIVLGTGFIYVYDSVGGGSIESSTQDAITMGNGSAKFENIIIKASGDGMDAVYCDGGNLIVEDCILSAPKAAVNVANGSEKIEANARSVVTVIGGKFSNYSPQYTDGYC